MSETKTYNLKEGIIDSFYQKSYKFIYPLMGISLGHKILPAQTYMSWQDRITINDFKLICVYELSDSPEFKAFERKILLRHQFFEDYKEGIGNKGIYIFNLKHFKKDIRLLMASKYSLLSAEAKKILLDYYSVNRFSREYVDSFLNPENYYSIYASHLDVSEKLLREVGELGERFTREKENLIMSVLEPKFLI